MATSTTAVTTPWRRQVAAWLQAVVGRHRQVRWGDLRAIASQFRFPQSPMWSAMRWLSGELAGWAMRRLLRAIAEEFGLGLSDTEIDILSDVALASL
jgi:hypothetical protein